MSTIYTQATVTSVGVGPTGHVHNRATPADGRTPFALECVACEPYLVKEGWVYSPELVPLTDTQIREKERVEREGNLAVKQASEQLATIAGQLVSGGGAASGSKPKRTITDEQKAKMAAGRAAKATKKAAVGSKG